MSLIQGRVYQLRRIANDLPQLLRHLQCATLSARQPLSTKWGSDRVRRSNSRLKSTDLTIICSLP